MALKCESYDIDFQPLSMDASAVSGPYFYETFYVCCCWHSDVWNSPYAHSTIALVHLFSTRNEFSVKCFDIFLWGFSQRIATDSFLFVHKSQQIIQ